jgi:hypothetical protein
MLKITTPIDEGRTVLELEGKLAGPWVEELAACWRQKFIPHQPATVILKMVTFIDAAGRELLAEIHRQGAELIADGCMTKAIIEDIMRGERS